jgi:hypothetical protein
VAVVLVLSAFLGEPILELFGIKMASFSVAGGILVLIMAIAMLSARPDRTTPEETAEAARKHDLAVAPLAVPLIAAGPDCDQQRDSLRSTSEGLVRYRSGSTSTELGRPTLMDGHVRKVPYRPESKTGEVR